MGTGFHGTLAGNVYCSSKKVLDDIRAFKGMQPAVEEEEAAGEGEEDQDETTARSPQVRRRKGEGRCIVCSVE